MRIALVSRELYPYVGGGIAPIVAAAARSLSTIADVILVTSADHREEHDRLREEGDPRVLPSSVNVLFVEEPGPSGFGGFFSYMHAYSARVHEALLEAYGERGPDIIEFCDYLGEGFVTIQAAHTRAPWLRDTLVCVRLHTTAEICAILDGHLDDSFPSAAMLEAERYCLHHADRLLWSGGDVLATYQRLYGQHRLAPARNIPDAFLDEAEPGPTYMGGPLTGQPLRLLYLGRMERRKGPHNLLRGLLDSGRDDWRLTLLGGDTETGPLGTSMRDVLMLTAADDQRVIFHQPVPRTQVADMIRRHDLVVIPSLWECWPNVAREALQQNRPIVATAVGGLCELVQEGRSGWLAESTDPAAIAAVIEERLDDPESVTELIATAGPRAVFDELTDEAAFLDRYRRLADEARPRAADARPEDPLVSVIVPYFRLEALVEETLDSVAAQTYPNIETIVINDGSLRDVDKEVLARVGERHGVTVVTQVNSGLGAARNMGVAQAQGKYLLPLDADDLIVPTFVERCVDVLEADRQLSYVGTWVRYMEPDGTPMLEEFGGYMPYGNWSWLMHGNNVGGTCTSLIRRSVFDRGFRYSDELTSFEDWFLYQEMHDAGLHGAIIPERLFQYRVRTASMMREVGTPRLERLHGELKALVRERRVRWVRGQTEVAPAAVDLADPEGLDVSVERLQQTVRALREANAQLAAAVDGARGAAAAAVLDGPRKELSRAQARIAELEAELSARRAVRDQRLARKRPAAGQPSR